MLKNTYMYIRKIMTLQWKFIAKSYHIYCSFGAFRPWTLTNLNVTFWIWNHATSLLRSKILIFAENCGFTMKNIGYINYPLNMFCSFVLLYTFSYMLSKNWRGWATFCPNPNVEPVWNSQKIGKSNPVVHFGKLCHACNSPIPYMWWFIWR